jgi:hypothetical protein
MEKGGVPLVWAQSIVKVVEEEMDVRAQGSNVQDGWILQDFEDGTLPLLE